MTTDQVLKGKLITLRQIELSDCTETYEKWLNDIEVNQYLETKWFEQTMESIQAFVKEQRENDHSVLFAMLHNRNGKHIGNIKIGPINRHYSYADISYFIGDKSYWKKGIATEAVFLICKFGFEKLLLHRIEAGAYADAVGSWKALEHNGFLREGVYREMVCLNGRYTDVYGYGLLRDEFCGGKMEELQ